MDVTEEALRDIQEDIQQREREEREDYERSMSDE